MPQFVHLSRWGMERRKYSSDVSVSSCWLIQTRGRGGGEETGNALEVIDLVEELQVRGWGGKGGGGDFSHLEICADHGQVSAYETYLYVSAASLLGFPVTQGGVAEIHAAYFSLWVK